MKSPVSLLTLLAITATTLAFSPYNGQKFKDARFSGNGSTLLGERRVNGAVDFKFAGTDLASKCSFKGNFESEGRNQRFRGTLDFNADGTCEINGLPGQEGGKISGRYVIDGTTVKFEGEKTVPTPLGDVTVKVEGEISINPEGEVKITGKVNAGSLGRGTFSMDSAREPRPE